MAEWGKKESNAVTGLFRAAGPEAFGRIVVTVPGQVRQGKSTDSRTKRQLNQRTNPTLGRSIGMTRRFNCNTVVVCLGLARGMVVPVRSALAEPTPGAPSHATSSKTHRARTAFARVATKAKTVATKVASTTRSGARASAARTSAVSHAASRGTAHLVLAVARRVRRHPTTYERFTAASFNDNLTDGDVVAGEEIG